MPIDLILEGLVAVLLAVTVGYCFVLDRRLRALRDGQDGMKEIIRELNNATERAQAGIAQLKISGDAVGTELRDTVAKARELSDELSLMLDSGNRIADRLEGSAAQASSGFNESVLDSLNATREAKRDVDAEGDGAVDESLLNALRQAR